MKRARIQSSSENEMLAIAVGNEVMFSNLSVDLREEIIREIRAGDLIRAFALALPVNSTLAGILQQNINSNAERIQNRFIEAVKAGEKELVAALLNLGARVNDVEMHGVRALTCAAEKGYLQIVELLIREGADLEAENMYGATPLICAVENGHIQIVELLLAAGADINAIDNCDRTALINVAENGKFQMAELLIKAGADIEAEDEDGYTALLRAAEYGYTKIVDLLLREKANVDHIDIRWYGPVIASLFLINGAKIDTTEIASFLEHLNQTREIEPNAFSFIATSLAAFFPTGHPLIVELDFTPNENQQAEIARIRGHIDNVATVLVSRGYNEEEARNKAMVAVARIFVNIDEAGNSSWRSDEAAKDYASVGVSRDKGWLYLSVLNKNFVSQRAILHAFEYIYSGVKEYNYAIASVALLTTLFECEIREGESAISVALRAVENHRAAMRNRVREAEEKKETAASSRPSAFPIIRLATAIAPRGRETPASAPEGR